jgi:excisionase family DNA binding protein
MTAHTIAEAARLLGISRQAALGLVRRGALDSTTDKRGNFQIDDEAIRQRIVDINQTPNEVTTAQAADLIGVSQRHVGRLIANGTLGVVRTLGTSQARLLDRSEVEAVAGP